MLKLVLVLAIAIPASVLGDQIKVTTCKNGGPLPHSFGIEGCDESGCVIYNKVPLIVTGQFIASFDANKLSTSLKAYVAGIGLEQALPDEIKDGCNSVEGGCPIEIGETRDINVAFTVDSPLKDISPDIELKIMNDNSVVVMCVRTKVTLKNP